MLVLACARNGLINMSKILYPGFYGCICLHVRIVHQGGQDMQDRVKNFDSYLGETPCRSVEDERRFITLFYWSNRESIMAWRDDAEHTRVRQLGHEKVLGGYKIRVCEVEREYDWEWLE